MAGGTGPKEAWSGWAGHGHGVGVHKPCPGVVATPPRRRRLLLDRPGARLLLLRLAFAAAAAPLALLLLGLLLRQLLRKSRRRSRWPLLVGGAEGAGGRGAWYGAGKPGGAPEGAGPPHE